VAICGNSSPSNQLYSQWYCQHVSPGRSIITSIVPTILLMLWQNLIMPNALYRCKAFHLHAMPLEPWSFFPCLLS